MNTKAVILFVSLLAIGIFMIPNTLALYTGQHEFVEGARVDCAKCHNTNSDMIAAELYNGSAHETMDCGACHGYVGNGPQDKDGHAATVSINCIGCHSVGEGGPKGTNVSAELELPGSAHGGLIPGDDTGGINDRDLVCVACHTNVDVSLINVSLTPDAGTITIEGGGDRNWMYEHVD